MASQISRSRGTELAIDEDDVAVAEDLEAGAGEEARQERGVAGKGRLEARSCGGRAMEALEELEVVGEVAQQLLARVVSAAVPNPKGQTKGKAAVLKTLRTKLNPTWRCWR